MFKAKINALQEAIIRAQEARDAGRPDDADQDEPF
jgi:hypothetical protein